MDPTTKFRLELDRIPVTEFGLTLAQWRKLMYGEGRGRPQGIFADQESWVTVACRKALEEMDERDETLRYDVTWMDGGPIFTKRER